MTAKFGTDFALRLVRARLDPAATLCHRVTLDPADADGPYCTTDDLARTGHVLVYQRLQDGTTFGARATVVAVLADDVGTARITAVRTLVARRPGSAPGDIVYDPEIAHLLHNFIARARTPTFYDAFDDDRGSPLLGLALRWPDADICRGDDPRIAIVSGG